MTTVAQINQFVERVLGAIAIGGIAGNAATLSNSAQRSAFRVIIRQAENVPNNVGTKRNPNKLAPDDRAEGPHSTFRQGEDGRVTNYETYDRNLKTGEFGAERRYRGKGKPHGGVEPPQS